MPDSGCPGTSRFGIVTATISHLADLTRSQTITYRFRLPVFDKANASLLPLARMQVHHCDAGMKPPDVQRICQRLNNQRGTTAFEGHISRLEPSGDHAGDISGCGER